MTPYPKIVSVYKRDPHTKYRTMLHGLYSLPEFHFLEHCDWVWTEKLHGTNIRIQILNDTVRLYGDDGKTPIIHTPAGQNFLYRGRTERAELPKGMVDRLNELLTSSDGDSVFNLFPEGDTCLYGEGVGASINKGGGYCSGLDFVLFDVKCGNWWLKREDVNDIARKLHIQYVPTIGIGSLPAMANKVRLGFNSKWGNFPAEGIVARPYVELKNRAGNRIICKLKTADYKEIKKDGI